MRDGNTLFNKGGSMKEALVFGGHNALDFSDIRLSVLRIPEVSLRIEAAQKIWDEECRTSFSFHHFLSSEDSTFYTNISLKSLTLAVVQLGLLDRYRRLFREPTFLVGNTKNDPVLLVATGQLTLRELITLSRACRVLRPMAPLHVADDTVLNGHALPQFQPFSKVEVDGQISYTAAAQADMNLQKILQDLVENNGVGKIIHVGPGSIDKSIAASQFDMRDVQVFESIDMDPMLGWFWTDLRRGEQQLQAAQ